MALLPKSYNTEDNNETGGFTPIEPGWYLAHIVKTDYKENRNKTGWVLALHFKIIDEESEAKGRMVFANLNLQHENADAERISTQQFNKLCQCIDKVGVQETDELIELPLYIKVKIRPETPQYPASNDVVDYKSVDDSPGDEERPW